MATGAGRTGDTGAATSATGCCGIAAGRAIGCGASAAAGFNESNIGALTGSDTLGVSSRSGTCCGALSAS
ncbi:MAG TPA: hypothetical protein DD611_02145 [Alphaproteobacteria bacterium]|nr:hypothetical protein [Alphaproteobacteria bacterium]